MVHQRALHTFHAHRFQAGIERGVRTAAYVHHHQRKSVVHRDVAVAHAHDARAVANGLSQRAAKGDSHVLHQVMPARIVATRLDSYVE